MFSLEARQEAGVDGRSLVLDPPHVLPDTRLARVAVRANRLGPGAEGSVQLPIEILRTHHLHVNEPDVVTYGPSTAMTTDVP